MKSIKNTPSPQALKVLKSLQHTVKATLERKRKLGHYTVQWQDNKLIIRGDDAPDAENQ